MPIKSAHGEKKVGTDEDDRHCSSAITHSFLAPTFAEFRMSVRGNFSGLGCHVTTLDFWRPSSDTRLVLTPPVRPVRT